MRCKCGARTYERHLRKVATGTFSAHVFQLKAAMVKSRRG